MCEGVGQDLGYGHEESHLMHDMKDSVRLEKFQFLEKGQNRNFGYKIVISVKNPKFIL